MADPCAERLTRGCSELGLDPTARQLEALLAYLDLLVKWNRAYNLTAVREREHMVPRHLLDSLAVAPHIAGRRCLDVGTGAGLPGIPLAILLPGVEFHLLDSNGKKTRFLFQVKTALALDNIVVHQARVETFTPTAPYDEVLSRAFASLEDTVSQCRHLLEPGGRLLAMKGVLPTGELEAVAGVIAEPKVHTLSVPGLNEERHLVEIRLQSDS